jgi:hypothetical protein
VLPWKNSVTGCVHAKTRKRAREAVVDQHTAFKQTMLDGHALILIVDQQWKDSVFQAESIEENLSRYFVLDYFIVTDIWTEPSSVPGASDAYFVRFEKWDLQLTSWWIVPSIPPPLQDRRDFTPLTRHQCRHCGEPCPQIYAEDWFCLSTPISLGGCVLQLTSGTRSGLHSFRT